MLHGHAHVGVAVEFYESEGAFSNTDIDYAMDKFLVPAGFATNQEIAAHAPTPFKAQMASKAARLERSGARGARGERDRDGNWVQQWCAPPSITWSTIRRAEPRLVLETCVSETRRRRSVAP